MEDMSVSGIRPRQVKKMSVVFCPGMPTKGARLASKCIAAPARPFTTTRQCCEQEPPGGLVRRHQAQEGNRPFAPWRIPKKFIPDPQSKEPSLTKSFRPNARGEIAGEEWPRPSRNQQARAAAQSRRDPTTPATQDIQANDIGLFVDGRPYQLSSILLRDLCSCPSCLDASTQQKLFSTADVPPDIKAREATQSEDGVSIFWTNDVPGYDEDHVTFLDTSLLRELVRSGSGPMAAQTNTTGPRTIWDAETYIRLQDFEYEAYVEDDATLFQALQQLHTHGLLFLKDVPESEKSVSTIAERIGPVKNTFYGYTWDVRSVPLAKNVAYTSQDLGFHMDLLYMHQPPHLQFLHCIRSSSAGGASLFTDSFRAAAALQQTDFRSFQALTSIETNFHYNHPSSDLYHQSRPVLEMRPIRLGGLLYHSIAEFIRAANRSGHIGQTLSQARRDGTVNFMDFLDSVAWSPPFQAPFGIRSAPGMGLGQPDLVRAINYKVDSWHAAASKFNRLIHRPEGIYERLMKPGECVIFDNRRVLHARRAFEVGDVGRERWLRGAYLDKDPFWSKMRVLGMRFARGDGMERQREAGSEQYFEQAASPSM